MIKKLLNKKLTPAQFGKLSALKRRLAFDDLVTQVKAAIVHKSLPAESLVDLKTEINVVGKLDYEPHDIFLHVDSMIEHGTRLHSCRKEPDTVKWIEDYMKPGDVFFDVGANVGAYSLIAAKYFAGAVKVYAFEPAFLNFSQLCRNLFLNHCQEAIFPLSVALSDKTSIGEFNYHDLVPGGALHTMGEAIDHKGEAFTPVFVQRMLSYRLDDLIELFEIPKPTHIKIDVDGIEKAVLEGAANTLSGSSVQSIDVELEEGPPEQAITALLVEKGFTLEARHQRWTPGMLNCIFKRKTA